MKKKTLNESALEIIHRVVFTPSTICVNGPQRVPAWVRDDSPQSLECLLAETKYMHR